MPKIKKWLGEKAGFLAVALFVASLVLYGVAFLTEKGFNAFSPATVIAAVATALLLAATSVTLEQYVKSSLTDHEVGFVLMARSLGLSVVKERNVLQGKMTGLPDDIKDNCNRELVVVAYSADKFITGAQQWIMDYVDEGKHVGLLILHPENNEQATETEGRDISSQIETTLSIAHQIASRCRGKAGSFEVRGFRGHFYFTGVFVDRHIMVGDPSSVHVGLVCVQLKANYKSQHEGLVLTLAKGSRYAGYYSSSCRAVWLTSETLVMTRPPDAPLSEQSLDG